MLTESERRFIEKRRTLANLWPYVGSGIIAGLLGFSTWLWVAIPMMINPWATVRAIEAGSVEETTLMLMAVMLPILMLACLGVLVVLVGFLFVTFANERKLIRTIDRLTLP